MNWRTANNHRKKAARRRVFWIGRARYVTWSQCPRRPKRMIEMGGRKFYVGARTVTVGEIAR